MKQRFCTFDSSFINKYFMEFFLAHIWWVRKDYIRFLFRMRFYNHYYVGWGPVLCISIATPCPLLSSAFHYLCYFFDLCWSSQCFIRYYYIIYCRFWTSVFRPFSLCLSCLVSSKFFLYKLYCIVRLLIYLISCMF